MSRTRWREGWMGRGQESCGWCQRSALSCSEGSEAQDRTNDGELELITDSSFLLFLSSLFALSCSPPPTAL